MVKVKAKDLVALNFEYHEMICLGGPNPSGGPGRDGRDLQWHDGLHQKTCSARGHLASSNELPKLAPWGPPRYSLSILCIGQTFY